MEAILLPVFCGMIADYEGWNDLDQGALHLISAFASEYGVVLDQLNVADKSNELTAIQE